jgi:hypothetical protein
LRMHIVRSTALVLALRKLGSPSITTLKLPRQKNHTFSAVVSPVYYCRFLYCLNYC